MAITEQIRWKHLRKTPGIKKLRFVVDFMLCSLVLNYDILYLERGIQIDWQVLYLV